MQTEVTKKLFTVDEYYRMVEVGILNEGSRVELIHGEIIEMSPIGNPHVACVDRGAKLLVRMLDDRAIVSVQNPVRLDAYNEPQPDIVLMKPRADFYASKRHTPEDVLLFIEVSDTTLIYDRQVKLPIYATSGITEVWIEDLPHDRILVHRDPASGTYHSVFTLHRGEPISITSFPDIVFEIDDLLGPALGG